MKHRLLYIVILLFATLQTFAQVTYTYDNLYRLTKVTYPNGTTITYSFDALGNRTRKTVTGVVAQTYSIHVSLTPSGSGTVTGGGTFAEGTSIELNALPNAGYEFTRWSDGSTANPRSVTVTSDMNFVAEFTETTIIPDLLGDVVADGKINNQDLNALVDAYLSDASASTITDLDNDGFLSIADVARLVGIINEGSSPVNNNGHKYVDLGLPSGTLWATCNVGATTPEESGELYAWGETETKDNYSWATYKWCNGDVCNSTNHTLTKYCLRAGYGTMDGKVSLDLEDDVAHVKWGGSWHIPTTSEFQELIDNCTVEQIEMSDGNDAYKFTGSNGNSIIMPYAGYWRNETYRSGYFYYWSSEQYTSEISSNNHGTNAFSLNSNPDLVGYARYRGHAIRPVLSDYTPIVQSTEIPTSHMNHNLVNLGLPSGTLWATCNLGATSPENYGCYYSWAETRSSCDGKNDFSEDTYQYYNGTSMTNYLGEGTLSNADDAATQKWGGKWRMPTRTEIIELENENYTTCVWTSINGINGILITSKIPGYEGNSIFLPAAGYYRNTSVRYDGEDGYYWGSTIRDVSGESTFESGDCMSLSDGGMSKGARNRYWGFSIRPVVSVDDIVQ